MASSGPQMFIAKFAKVNCKFAKSFHTDVTVWNGDYTVALSSDPSIRVRDQLHVFQLRNYENLVRTALLTGTR